MPLTELEKRLADLPADKEIVGYCRGPFCLMSDEDGALGRPDGRGRFRGDHGGRPRVLRPLPAQRPGFANPPGQA